MTSRFFPLASPDRTAPRAASPRALRASGVLALAVALAASPLAAQETDETLDLEMGTAVDEAGTGPDTTPVGEPYILEVSGDWEIRCIATSLEHDPCALHQLLQDGAGNSVATIELVNLPEGNEAAAGATIVTPLETLLTRQLTLSVDGGQARRYPFTFCTQTGCAARVGFTEAEVDQFRRGAVARLTIFPAGAPDTPVNLEASLSGFTAGYRRIEELNELNAEAIAAARAAAEAEGGEQAGE